MTILGAGVLGFALLAVPFGFVKLLLHALLRRVVIVLQHVHLLDGRALNGWLVVAPALGTNHDASWQLRMACLLLLGLAEEGIGFVVFLSLLEAIIFLLVHETFDGFIFVRLLDRVNVALWEGWLLVSIHIMLYLS